MAVPKPLRKESKVEFINSAATLYKHTFTTTNKFSNRVYDKVGRKLFDLASDIYSHTIAINSVRPTNPANFEFRHKHLLEAKAKLDIMSAQITQLRQLDVVRFKTKNNPNNQKPWTKWSQLIKDTTEIIVALKNSDLRKHKELIPW